MISCRKVIQNDLSYFSFHRYVEGRLSDNSKASTLLLFFTSGRRQSHNDNLVRVARLINFYNKLDYWFFNKPSTKGMFFGKFFFYFSYHESRVFVRVLPQLAGPLHRPQHRIFISTRKSADPLHRIF